MHPAVQEQSPGFGLIECAKVKLDEVRFGKALAYKFIEGLLKIAVNFG
jgi:hypothetical protein